MKKFFKMLNVMVEGQKGKYALCFILQIFSVFFSLLSTFMSKLLVDCLTGDIYNTELTGSVESILAKIMGGADFLCHNYWMFCLIIVLIGMAISLIFIVRHILNSDVSTRIGKRMRLILFNHIERLPYSKQKRNKNGDLIQTCTRDEEVLRRFALSEMFMITYTFFLVLFSFLLLYSINWQIALTAIAILPIMFIYSFFLIKEVRKRYRLTDDSEGLMTAKIEENLSAVRIVKAYNNENYEIRDFDKYLADYKFKFIRWRKMSSFFFASSDIFVFGQIAFSTVFALYLASTGAISAGTFVITFSFVNMIVWPVREVATIVSNLARAMVSIDRMNKIINEPVEDTKSGIKPEIRGDISFKDISFHYDDDSKLILDHVSLDIKQGETIAIMGKTGSGKSTLVALLSRLYDTTDGEILIDGNKINAISKEWLRKNVAMVLQEPFLFSKTIEDNLKLARKDASEEKIYEAARVADIHDSIVSFDKGYLTPVGEKGVTLSGGQKQRLAIARTILCDAPILVFDDSLSAVDTETDIKIRTALKKRNNKSTTIIITHRVSTAKDADKIIVLEEGKISEEGTHNDLISHDGLYKRIYEIQTRMV